MFRMCGTSFPTRGSHNMAPPSSFLVPRNFFHWYQFSSHLFSLSLSYLLFPQPYSSFAVNSLGNSQLNSFSSSSSSCCLSSLSSSPYSLSNSSTSPFAFSRFSLLSQVSSSAYTFHTPYMILSPPLYTIPALTGMPHLKCPLYSAPVPFVIGCVLDFSSTLFAAPFVAWPHALPLLPLATSFLLSKKDTFCTCVPFLHT